MNRRQFTLTLATLPATSALPNGLTAAVAPKTVAAPAGTYAWAQLIARAQNRCSPAMLARQLRLSPEVAQQLFAEMLRDGVLRPPTAAGVAQATQPINATGHQIPGIRKTLTELSDALYREEPPKGARGAPDPLVKADEPCLGCAETTEEDAHASPDQPLQESPARG